MKTQLISYFFFFFLHFCYLDVDHFARMQSYFSRPNLNNRLNNSELLPLMDAEEIRNFYKGEVCYKPFGESMFGINVLNKAIAFVNYVMDRAYFPKASYICSKSNCGKLFFSHSFSYQ